MKHLTDDELQRYLDSPAAGRNSRMAAHLQTCSRCRHELETYRKLFGLLKSAPETSLSPHVQEEVMRCIEGSPMQRRVSMEGVLFALAVLAGMGIFAYFVVSGAVSLAWSVSPATSTAGTKLLAGLRALTPAALRTPSVFVLALVAPALLYGVDKLFLQKMMKREA